MPMRGHIPFIPFLKRRPLLYRYTSIDKLLKFSNLAICLPYGAIVYVNEPLNSLIINELKKKQKKMKIFVARIEKSIIFAALINKKM